MVTKRPLKVGIVLLNLLIAAIVAVLRFVIDIKGEWIIYAIALMSAVSIYLSQRIICSSLGLDGSRAGKVLTFGLISFSGICIIGYFMVKILF